MAARGQKNSGTGSSTTTSSPTQSSSPSSSSGIAGLSYSQQSWDSQLGFPTQIPPEKRVVLCFKLTTPNSGSTPLLLEPVANISTPFYDNTGKVIEGAPGCFNFDYNHPYSHPIKLDQALILAVDIGNIPRDRIRYVTLNVTMPAGQNISTDSIRPSLAAGNTGQQNFGANVLFLTWPQPIAGDVIPTFTLTFDYTPVQAGMPWAPRTIYPAGSVVVPEIPNGHYYTALNGGLSGNTAPAFPAKALVTVADSAGGNLAWSDQGTAIPAGTPAWTPGTAYGAGSRVTPPAPGNGHFYATAVAGVSGAQAPAWPVGGAPVTEGPGVIWMDAGASSPANGKTIKAWLPSVPYSLGDTIIDPATGHYFTAISQGVSGTVPPIFAVNAIPNTAASGTVAESPVIPTVTDNEITWKVVSGNPKTLPLPAACTGALQNYAANTVYAKGSCAAINDRLWVQVNPAPGHSYIPPMPQTDFTVLASLPVTWIDDGSTAPASVASGQTSDVPITFSYTLPQSHTLDRFNLASGIVVSSIKNVSYVYTTAPTSTTPGVTQQVSSGPIVDPVLLVTAYVFGRVDAERPWHPKDLIPGATMGFSLTAPSSNFYFGASSEFFLRNLQAVYGFSLAKVPTLAPPGTVQAATATTPATVQRFAKGGFVGLSFNITGFIQSLFTAKAGS
jgi:hypothetical protein